MMSVDQSEPEATYYTVVSGDTLSKISKAQYGDPNKYMKIFEANKPMLTHPDKIYPGQVLRIPPALNARVGRRAAWRGAEPGSPRWFSRTALDAGRQLARALAPWRGAARRSCTRFRAARCRWARSSPTLSTASSTSC